MERAYDTLTQKCQWKSKDKCELFGQLLAKRLQQMKLIELIVMHDIKNIMYQVQFCINKKRLLQRLYTINQNISSGTSPNHNASAASSFGVMCDHGFQISMFVIWTDATIISS